MTSKVTALLLLLLAVQGLVQGQTVSSSQTPGAIASACPATPPGATLEEVQAGTASQTIVLVDVRTPEELHETGKLPGSYNIPLSEVATAFSLPEEEFVTLYGFTRPTPEQSNSLVFTCRSGVRATRAWELVRPLGYCNARVYFGSFLQWSARGQPLVPV